MGCPPVNCTAERDVLADPDIAGPGVMISFIATLGLSIVVSITVLVLGALADQKLQFWARVLEKLLLGFSDQQIVTGIGIQLVGFAKICSYSIYHARIIGGLSILSTLTHLLALYVLQDYFLRNPIVARFRIPLLVVNGLLIIPTTPILWISSTVSYSAPGACAYASLPIPGEAYENTAHVVILICVALWFVLLVGLAFTSLSRRLNDCLRASRLLIRLWPLSLIFFVISVFVVCVILLSRTQVFGSASITIIGNEKEWGFGQLLPVLVLALPFLNIVELFSEENGASTAPSTPANQSPEPQATLRPPSMNSEDREDSISLGQLSRHDTEARIEGTGVSSTDAPIVASASLLARSESGHENAGVSSSSRPYEPPNLTTQALLQRLPDRVRHAPTRGFWY